MCLFRWETHDTSPLLATTSPPLPITAEKGRVVTTKPAPPSEDPIKGRLLELISEQGNYGLGRIIASS
jgi:hypothetical protein